MCAKVCHKDHELAFSKHGSFFCDCGARGEAHCKVCSCVHAALQSTCQPEYTVFKPVTTYVCMYSMCSTHFFATSLSAQALTPRAPDPSAKKRKLKQTKKTDIVKEVKPTQNIQEERKTKVPVIPVAVMKLSQQIEVCLCMGGIFTFTSHSPCTYILKYSTCSHCMYGNIHMCMEPCTYICVHVSRLVVLSLNFKKQTTQKSTIEIDYTKIYPGMYPICRGIFLTSLLIYPVFLMKRSCQLLLHLSLDNQCTNNADTQVTNTEDHTNSVEGTQNQCTKLPCFQKGSELTMILTLIDRPFSRRLCGSG